MATAYERRREMERKQAHARRYDAGHRRVRTQLMPFVNAGLVRCARGAACRYAESVDGELVGGIIEPGEPWDLGHDDLTLLHSGPEHAACNRGAPARNKTSRQW